MMIISVSRRTDIPAFYMGWFLNRVNEGFVYVRNPMNSKQIGKVSLQHKDVSCYVFWTKNPKELLNHHDEIRSSYMVQLSITPYTIDLESHVKDKIQIIEDAKKLSKLIEGRLVWRYDPIIFTDKYTKAYHYVYFEKLCKHLSGCIKYCVVSFVELYKKVSHQLKECHIPNEAEKESFLLKLVAIANEYDIEIKMCASSNDYSKIGVKKSQCIDAEILKEISIEGFNIDKYQRANCSCIESIDIGSYDTCVHGCIYCYANKNHLKAQAFYESFDSKSTILGLPLTGDETIKSRIIIRKDQISLFDL